MISYRRADLLDQFEDHGSVSLDFNVVWVKAPSATDRAYYIEHVGYRTAYTPDATEAFKDKIQSALDEARFKEVQGFHGKTLLRIPMDEQMHGDEHKICEWAEGFLNGMGHLFEARFGFKVKVVRSGVMLMMTVTA